MAQLRDIVDSYYKFIKARVTAVNSSRKFGGLVAVSAWPLETVEEECFYLLHFDPKPSPGVKSRATPRYYRMVQWTWLVQGTDLQPGEIGLNRGDRYALHEAMVEELIQAHAVQAVARTTFSLGVSGTLESTAYDIPQYASWSIPDFGSDYNKETGLVYGLSTVYVSGTASIISQ